MTRPDAQTRQGPRSAGPIGADLGGRLHSHLNPRETLLHALESATGRAPSRAGNGWRSRCPSCGGKSEKVSIAEAVNGSVLMHAFCGCEPAAVLAACGLTLAALFPARLDDLTPEGRRVARYAAREAGWRSALEILAFEAKIVEIAAHDVAKGAPLAQDDHDRLLIAVQRIEGAREVLSVR